MFAFCLVAVAALDLWHPTPPPRAPAPVVVYVHGYGTTTHEALSAHDLHAQFAKSGRKAVFLTPEAPASPREPVAEPDLERLLQNAERELGAPLSREDIVLIGHSAAYRTLRLWLDHPGVGEVILLDAMYGDTTPFARWIARTPKGRLTIVSRSTIAVARTFLRRLGPAEIEAGRVLHLFAGTTHMGIVTEGEWIPAMLDPRRVRPARAA